MALQVIEVDERDVSSEDDFPTFRVIHWIGEVGRLGTVTQELTGFNVWEVTDWLTKPYNKFVKVTELYVVTSIYDHVNDRLTLRSVRLGSVVWKNEDGSLVSEATLLPYDWWQLIPPVWA